jgi:hypothetical protein
LSPRRSACLVQTRADNQSVTVCLWVYPSRQQYRLPREEASGEVTKALAEVLGEPRLHGASEGLSFTVHSTS